MGKKQNGLVNYFHGMTKASFWDCKWHKKAINQPEFWAFQGLLACKKRCRRYLQACQTEI
jgi:hypothetical protein